MGKRKWMIGLSVILLLIFCSMTSLAAEERTGAPVSLKVSSIYGEIGRIGSHIPLTIQVYNQSEAPFNGTICIRTLESETDGSEIYEYEYPVSVSAAETKTTRVYVPLGQKSNELYVCLRDAGEKELTGKSLQLNISREMGRLLIGALSDDVEDIRYLDEVSLDYGMVRSVLVPMETASFPDDVRGLDMLDILVIDDFDSGMLSEKQRDAILQWMKNGGRLIFGTGRQAKRTFEAFAPEFETVSIDKPQLMGVSMGAEYSKETPWDSVVNMVCTEIKVSGGKVVMESDGTPLLVMKTCGEGQAGFFSFALGDLKEFVEKSPSYGIRMLTAIMGEEELSNLYFYGAYERSEEYWNAESLVNTGNADRLPNLLVYALAISAYIIMVGPGLYLILKKRSLGRYYGATVVLFSVAASAVVYLMGIGTRFTQEFYTYASVYDVKDETVEELTYLNIRTPDSRPFSIRIAAGYQVRPLTRSSRYDDDPQVKLDIRKAANISLRFDEAGTVIQAGRLRAFEPRFFQLNRESENTLGGAIAADLEYFDGKISGYISNDFPFSLSQAALLCYGQLLPLGDLQPGETLEFSEEPLLVWPVGMSYLVVENLVGEADEDSLSDSEYLRMVERNSLYSFFIDKYYGRYNDEMRLVAFGPADGMEVLKTEHQVVDGMAVYTEVLPVSSERDGVVYRSGQMEEPSITSGSGNYYGNTMTVYSAEPLVVEYSLGEDIQVEKLSFLPISEEFLMDPRYSWFKRFTGEAWFYNYEKRVYERADLNQVDFSREELSEYLSADNTLLVQYVGGESEMAGVSAALPLLMVTGRER